MELKRFIIFSVLLIEITLLVISLLGNSVVILVMMRKKSLAQASANCYIIAIASVSLITSIFSIPFAIYGSVRDGKSDKIFHHKYDISRLFCD